MAKQINETMISDIEYSVNIVDYTVRRENED